MFNSIFYRISWFYVHPEIFHRSVSLRFDSFSFQGIAVGQTSDYKIDLCYNKKVTNKKNLWFGLCRWFLERFCPQEFLEFNVCSTVNTQHTFSMYLRRCISQRDLFISCMIVLKSIQAIFSKDLIRLISNVLVKSLEATTNLSSWQKFHFHQMAELLHKTKLLLIWFTFPNIVI